MKKNGSGGYIFSLRDKVFTKSAFLIVAAALFVGGFFIAYAQNEVTINPNSPSAVDLSFAPTLGADITRGDTAYLGRNTVNTTGLELGTGDTIKWKVTITGPSTLSAGDIDLDEVGWADLNGNSIIPYHYPLSGTGGVLEAVGSCDNPLPSGHDEPSTCTTAVGFSVDANDDFTNADKIKFNLTAPNGSYTIKYELVDTSGDPDVVLGMHEVTVNVVNPVSVGTAGTQILTQNGGTEVASFSPVLGSSVIRGTGAYYGINAVSSANFSNVSWRIKVHHDSADLNPGMVTITEKGWFDATSNAVEDSAYAPSEDGNDLIFTGNSGWGTAAGDNFTNVDLIHFDTSAPLGNYTITRELVDNASNAVISNAYALPTVEVVNPSAAIVSANPNTVDAGFIPEISSTITRGSDAYLGRTTTYTGPQIGLGDPETIKWKVTVSGPPALTAEMVDLDEVGWKDQTDQNVESFHYPFAAQEDGSLVALGSCDGNVGTVGHDNECPALIGFSLVTNDVFTNADKIKFNSGAPAGEYTIIYELVNTADGLVVGTHVVTVEVVNTEITITADAKSKTYGDANPTLTYNITSGSLEEGDAELEGVLSRDVGENVGTYGITIGSLDSANPNYDITFVGADLTINAKPITVTAVPDTKIYDGTTDSVGIPTITDGSLAFSDTAGFTQSYDTKDVGTGKTLAPSGVVNDGNGGNNYVVTPVNDTTGVITPASLTITADNKSKVYGTENPELTASYDGFVGGDTSAVLDTPVSLFTTANAASVVDTYEITVSDAADVNYNITLASGILTVTTAPITVTAVDKSKNYSEADPVLTYTNDPLVGSDAFTGSLSRDAGENVGTYAITQGTLALSSNYVLTFVPATLTINLNGFNATIALSEAGEWALISAPVLLSEVPTVTDNNGGAVALLVYRNGAFVVPSEGDDELVNPLSAFYVKTTNTGVVGLKSATISSPTQVSRQLSAGWNLVGTNNDGLAVNEFSSIQNTPTNAGMVTLFVPDTYNSRKDTGYTSWDDDANHDLNANPITALPENNLSAYDGYWVFMNAAKAFVKNL